MLSPAVNATYLVFMKSQVTNIQGGVLAFYRMAFSLVAATWATARLKDGENGESAIGVCFYLHWRSEPAGHLWFRGTMRKGLNSL
jgi:hypothetical protein